MNTSIDYRFQTLQTWQASYCLCSHCQVIVLAVTAAGVHNYVKSHSANTLHLPQTPSATPAGSPMQSKNTVPLSSLLLPMTNCCWTIQYKTIIEKIDFFAIHNRFLNLKKTSDVNIPTFNPCKL